MNVYVQLGGPCSTTVPQMIQTFLPQRVSFTSKPEQARVMILDSTKALNQHLNSDAHLILLTNRLVRRNLPANVTAIRTKDVLPQVLEILRELSA